MQEQISRVVNLPVCILILSLVSMRLMWHHWKQNPPLTVCFAFECEADVKLPACKKWNVSTHI